MKLGKSVLSSALVLALATGGSTAVFAAENVSSEENVESVSEQKDSLEITPFIDWSGDVTLFTGYWSNIATSNNIFTDRPTVYNASTSIGSVVVRVLDSEGIQIGSSYIIPKGASQKLDSIPAFSGTYTIQGKAYLNAGTYNLSVK